MLANSKRFWIRRHEVMKNSLIEILIEERERALPKKIRILWQDADYPIVNKPAFILTDATDDSLESPLRKHERNRGIVAVHRKNKKSNGLRDSIRPSGGRVKARPAPVRSTGDEAYLGAVEWTA